MHEIYTTYIENNNILFIKQWMSFVNILSYLDMNMTIWNDIPIHIKMVMTTRYGSFILNINKKAVNHKRLKRFVTREDWKLASLYLIPEMLHHLVIYIMQFTFKSTQLLWIVTSFQYNVLLLYDNGMHCLILKKKCSIGLKKSHNMLIYMQ